MTADTIAAGVNDGTPVYGLLTRGTVDLPSDDSSYPCAGMSNPLRLVAGKFADSEIRHQQTE